jgi:uncharacterized iron-regulated protein
MLRRVLKASQSHDIVILGENHGNKQEYQWPRSLVNSPELADSVYDIVMEFGNSLYQQVVDRYVRGDEVSIEEVQGAWRDTMASVGPPSPVYESLYQAVRDGNLKRKGKHQIRIHWVIPISIGGPFRKRTIKYVKGRPSLLKR